MAGIVAIVGRANVGKSTIFNRIVGERVSIVEDIPGVTRDRIYQEAEWLNRKFDIIDTGGIEIGDEPLLMQIRYQAELAIDEADVIILMTNGKEGLTVSDEEVAELLIRSKKPVVLAVNKIDNPNMRDEIYDYYTLGFGTPFPISGSHGLGIGDLLDEVFTHFPKVEEKEVDEDVIRFCLVGRPNVGKSSLLNAFVRESKAIVTEIAGTTRDIIEEYINIQGIPVHLIDTAGIRQTEDIVEKIGVERSQQAIEQADLILFLLNISEPLTVLDEQILPFIQDKTTLVVLNKNDLPQKISQKEIQEKIGSFPYVYISAQKQIGMEDLEKQMVKLILQDDIGKRNDVYLSNARHIQLLNLALNHIQEIYSGIQADMPIDLIQIDLTEAWSHLGEIIGENASDDLINQLFSQFCLGK